MANSGFSRDGLKIFLQEEPEKFAFSPFQTKKTIFLQKMR